MFSVAGVWLLMCGLFIGNDKPVAPLPLPAAADQIPAKPGSLPPEPIPADMPVPPPPGPKQPVPPSPDIMPSATIPLKQIEPHVPEPSFPSRVPEFLGDQAPIGSLVSWHWGSASNLLYVPSARYFKISDNDSPRPQTRDYFSFNYFYNLGGAANDAAGGGIQHTRIHREIFGVEWADSQGRSSIGLRLPIATYNAANTVPGLDGTSTDIGDLAVIFKELLWESRRTGSLLSAGLAVIPPTGPGSFAGSNYIKAFHNTSLQPFVGWIWAMDSVYLQGFTAVDAPTDLNDVTMLDNSLAAGYFLYQRHASNGLTAVVPTVEVHVNTPLNHRGIVRLNDPAGAPDMVDLTSGVQFEYRDRSSMGVAFAVPLTGPRMFDFEILGQFRWRY